MKVPITTAVCVLVAASLSAATLTVVPDADTTIWTGGINPGTPTGADVVAGTSGVGGVGRVLLRFNLSSLPANAIIDVATVKLKITKEAKVSPPPATFALHRLTRAWSEVEASWANAANGAAWSTSGGDYMAEASAAVAAGGDGTLLELASTELTADVQAWVDGSVGNAGWLLRVTDEGEFYSARRLASREAISDGPQLVVSYHTNAPLAAVTLSNVRVQGAEVRFDFSAVPGTLYAVEYVNAFGLTWNPLTNVTVTASGLATVMTVRTNDYQFYRVRSVAPTP